MDLIGDDQHFMLKADLGHTRQFLTGENNSQRVMRVTQQKDSSLLDLFLKHVPIYLVMQNVPLNTLRQWSIDLRNANIIFHFVELIINRRLDQHTFLRGSKRAGSHTESGENTGYCHQLIRLHLPTIQIIHAGGNGLFQRWAGQLIPQDTLLDHFMQLVQDWFGRGEIHICHPHRQNIFWIKRPFVVYVGVAAIWDVVKVGHGISAYFLYATIMPSRAGISETIQSESLVTWRVNSRTPSVAGDTSFLSKIRPCHSILSMINNPPLRNFSLINGSDAGYPSLSISLKMISKGTGVLRRVSTASAI